MNKRLIPFLDKTITLYSANHKNYINIQSLIRNPEDFKGDFNVQYLVDFEETTLPLIGNYKKDFFGEWDEKELEKEHVFVYEYYFDQAKRIVDSIKKLADKVIENPTLYEDPVFYQEYFDLIKEGYQFIENNQIKFESQNASSGFISIERAGLVCTRLAKGLNTSEVIDNEVRVVAKRIHLKQDPENFIAVSITFRDKKRLGELVNQKQVEIIDTVIASGASIAAFIICANEEKSKPSIIINKSINTTKQGVRFLQRTCKQFGIQAHFYTLGIGDILNNSYYLTGNRAIGDAGDVLCHFLPSR